MGIRFPREFFGVKIIYIREHVARKAVSVVVGGRGVWALLPDGSVGTNDSDFFRGAVPAGSQMEARLAEKLWRLGKMPKAQYLKLEASWKKKEAMKDKKNLVADLLSSAKRIGLPLTKEQQATLNKMAA